jgi:hypothetical protein
LEEEEGCFKANALSEVDAEEGAAKEVASKMMQGGGGRELEVVSALAFPCLYKYNGMFFLIFKLLKK